MGEITVYALFAVVFAPALYVLATSDTPSISSVAIRKMSDIVQRSGEHLVVFESHDSKKVLAVLNLRVLATEYSSIRKGSDKYKYAILGHSPSGDETRLLHSVYHVDEILDEIAKHIATYSKNTTFTIPEVWSSEYTGKNSE